MKSKLVNYEQLEEMFKKHDVDNKMSSTISSQVGEKLFVVVTTDEGFISIAQVEQATAELCIFSVVVNLDEIIVVNNFILTSRRPLSETIIGDYYRSRRQRKS